MAGINKPVKTERTHEENQERAYIAASRRSDRSLEARLESARRASEIHKKRTGRALRVTEQDVINEEMYEEEDEELPGHLRRIAQSLYCNNMWMDRRFESAYLTNMTMRHALMAQGFPNQMSTQYADPPFFAYQHQGPPAQGQYQQQRVPQSPTTAGSFRHQPYPMGYRQNAHQRSISLASPTPDKPGQCPQGYSPTTPSGEHSDEQRRMSLPTASTQSTPQMSNSTEMRPPMLRHASTNSEIPSPHLSIDTSQQYQHHTPHSQSFSPYSGPSYLDPLSQSFNPSPLTAALPPEQQQILGPALSPTDPTTQYLMAASHQIPQPFTYSYNSNGLPKNRSNQSYNTVTGMDQTPAPNAFGTTATSALMTFTNPPSVESEKDEPQWNPPSFGDGSLEDLNPDYYNTG